MNLTLPVSKVSLCLLFSLSSLIISADQALGQSMGINSTGAEADPSAALDVSATNKGVLIPRVALMATNSASPVSSPAASLLVYNTATAGTAPSNVIPGYYYWDGSKWVPLITSGTATTSGWSLAGNAGTDPATNFIGTTDNQPVVLKVNGQQAGLIATGSTYNVAFGIASLFYNTTGYGNTALGGKSLVQNTSGNHNTSVGYETLSYNGEGKYNVAVGSRALSQNRTGSDNTSTGFSSLYFNTSGRTNTATGSRALSSNSTGSFNTAGGGYALTTNSSGSYNTAMGYYALRFNQTGNSNVAIGTAALAFNKTKSNLVAVGDSALYWNGHGATSAYHSAENTAVGSKALFANTTGDGNTAVGSTALESNTAGALNTATGRGTLFSNTTGERNIAVGAGALYFNTTGSYNTAVGTGALGESIGGNYNTAVGFATGPAYDSYLHNTGAFGYAAAPTVSNYIRIGNTSVQYIGGQVAWGNYSDQRFKVDVQEDVKGLDFVLKLRPVTYHWDIDSLNRFIYGKAADSLFADSASLAGIINQERITYTGFLAQEVEQAAMSVGYDFSGVVAPANERTPYSVRYAEFVVPLVKAVQEQQSQLGQQNELLAGLHSRVERPVIKLRSAEEWADRVFEPSYRLRPLSEVEKYMNQHKHLPGVPSAQELAEKGVDVSAMLSKQMEKIEELTLYVVELEKKNNELARKNAKLEQLEVIVTELQKKMKAQRDVK